MFINNTDIDNIRKWQYHSIDTSISTQYLTCYWNKCVSYIPSYIAPNCITLLALGCLGLSSLITYCFIHNYHIVVILTNICLLWIYITLDAIDGKHARNINCSTPMGELLDHVCDNIGLIFILFSLCYSLSITNNKTIFLIINFAELLFLHEHILTLITKTLFFRKYTGPTEALIVMIIIHILCIFGLYIPSSWNPLIETIVIIFTCILSMYVFLLHNIQFDYISACLLYQLLIIFIVHDMNIVQLLNMSLFWTIPIAETIIAKMANRHINSQLIWILFLIISAPETIIFSTGIYCYMTFTSLCNGLNLYFLKVKNNMK
jgi:phosphatidylglycerophosphate synthase